MSNRVRMDRRDAGGGRACGVSPERCSKKSGGAMGLSHICMYIASGAGRAAGRPAAGTLAPFRRAVGVPAASREAILRASVCAGWSGRAPDRPDPGAFPNRLPASSSLVSDVRPKGAALIMVVITLTMLAMLGTAFLVFIRLESKAVRNISAGTQAEFAALSGLNHAVRVLRHAKSGRVPPGRQIATTDGFWDWDDSEGSYPSDADMLRSDPSANASRPEDRPFKRAGWPRFFEAHLAYGDRDRPAADIRDAVTARTDDPRYDYEGLVEELYDPKLRPISHSGVPDVGGDLDFPLWGRRVVAGGRISAPILHRDLARRWEVNANDFSAVSGDILDRFYRDSSGKMLPGAGSRVRAMRGDYYVWITDLDSKLFAPMKAYNGGGEDTSMEDTGKDPDTLLRNILRCLMSTWPGKAEWRPDLLLANPSSGEDIVTLDAAKSPGGFRSIGEVVERLVPASLIPDPADMDQKMRYMNAKYAIERYFTVLPYGCAGMPDPPGSKPPPRLNVNTAPWEVIAAALSQVGSPKAPDDPEDTDSRLAASPDSGLLGSDACVALARRMVKARPFLNRADLEDFFAACIADAGAYDRMLAAIPCRTDESGNPLPADRIKFMEERMKFFRGIFCDPAFGDGFAGLSEKQFNDVLNAIGGKGDGPSYYCYGDSASPEGNNAETDYYDPDTGLLVLDGDDKPVMQRWKPGRNELGIYHFRFAYTFEYDKGDGSDPIEVTVLDTGCMADEEGEYEDAYGRCTKKANGGGGEYADLTWGPMFKFKSDYFLIYVLGRATDLRDKETENKDLNGDGDKRDTALVPLATCRLSAVFDSTYSSGAIPGVKEGRIVWMRRQVTGKANIADPNIR